VLDELCLSISILLLQPFFLSRTVDVVSRKVETLGDMHLFPFTQNVKKNKAFT